MKRGELNSFFGSIYGMWLHRTNQLHYIHGSSVFIGVSTPLTKFVGNSVGKKLHFGTYIIFCLVLFTFVTMRCYSTLTCSRILLPLYSRLAGVGLDGSLGYELSSLFSLKTLWELKTWLYSSFFFLCIVLISRFVTCRDLSNNNLHGSIPYQLPPNLTYLYVMYPTYYNLLRSNKYRVFYSKWWHRNLATNNLSGNLPYSISNMVSLEYL